MLYIKSLLLNLFFVITFLLSINTLVLAEGKSDAAISPATIDNPDIPVDQLELMLGPLTKDELFAEADGWLELLQEDAKKVNLAQLAVKKADTDTDLSQAEKDAAKEKLMHELKSLRESREATIDRLNAVLKEINKKIGLGEKGKELDEVMPYRRYIDAVSGIKLDMTDTKSTWLSIKSWLFSMEGGIQWIKKILIFIVILSAFWILSKILTNAVKKAMGFTDFRSQILNDFFINSIRRVTLFIGLLVALAAIEINVAPIMAAIGAAGFVVAFALQSTLSNFASGIMIMFYRPFDVGDFVEAAGIAGKVKSMTLVSTTLLTPDNKLMVVPNNSIWNDVITNSTHSKERRVDLVFGIGYEDDIGKAMHVMQQVLDEHPLVLKDPQPTIQLNELGASSVNFICRPWVKTGDYWTVYWEVTRTVKERFDAAGISIPFPQTDVHIYQQSPALEPPSLKSDKVSATDPVQDIDVVQEENADGG